MTDKPLVLLPAAGFGTRVGTPNSKEILSGQQGRPLIETALKQAEQRAWPVHVITRKEKTELLDYLKDYQEKTSLQISVQIVEPTREWPETILKSKPYWHQKNILCLPDTIFSPTEIWDSLMGSQKELALATFQALDYSAWGVVRENGSSLEICEKPQEPREGMRAWGLIGFEPAAGESLFQAQLKSTFSHEWFTLKASFEIFNLENFQDLTR